MKLKKEIEDFEIFCNYYNIEYDYSPNRFPSLVYIKSISDCVLLFFNEDFNSITTMSRTFSNWMDAVIYRLSCISCRSNSCTLDGDVITYICKSDLRKEILLSLVKQWKVTRKNERENKIHNELLKIER